MARKGTKLLAPTKVLSVSPKNMLKNKPTRQIDAIMNFHIPCSVNN